MRRHVTSLVASAVVGWCHGAFEARLGGYWLRHDATCRSARLGLVGTRCGQRLGGTFRTRQEAPPPGGRWCVRCIELAHGEAIRESVSQITDTPPPAA